MAFGRSLVLEEGHMSGALMDAILFKSHESFASYLFVPCEDMQTAVCNPEKSSSLEPNHAGTWSQKNFQPLELGDINFCCL